METFYKKGIFRLGTIGDYQSTKKENIKDENEGYTHLILESETNQLLQSFCGGFNYLLFCGSYVPPEDPRAEYLKENFGPCVMKIENLNSFRKAISKHLNIRYSHYDEVDYSNLQIFKKMIDYDLYEEKSEIFTDRTFKEISRITASVSIFNKWKSFAPEHEMRFAFELPCDQKHPKTLHNKGLLDYIEVIE